MRRCTIHIVSYYDMTLSGVKFADGGVQRTQTVTSKRGSMTEQADGKDKSLPDMGQPGWIERAAELHWAVQIVAAALVVDSASMAVQKRKLLDFPWGAVDWSGRIGQLVVAVVVFSVLLSVVLPLCEAAPQGRRRVHSRQMVLFACAGNGPTAPVLRLQR